MIRTTRKPRRDAALDMTLRRVDARLRLAFSKPVATVDSGQEVSLVPFLPPFSIRMPISMHCRPVMSLVRSR